MSQPLGQPGNSGRPAILLLYFVQDKYLETTERQLYESLRKNAALLEARDAQTALKYLSSSPPPQSVLIADASVTEAAHAALLDALVEYARGGGRVVFGVRFAARFPYFEVSPFFRRFGMLWDAGKLCNSTFKLNPSGLPKPLSGDRLATTIATRVQQVANSGRDTAVYVLTSTPSPTLTPIEKDEEPSLHSTQSEFPVAFAPLAKGFVGYVGMLSGEPAATQILLEMCGVEAAFGVIDPNNLGGNASIRQVGRNPGPSGTAAKEKLKRPTVLILILSNNLPIGMMHKQLLSGLEKNAEVKTIKNRTAFLQHLHASPRPQAVIVADAAICEEPRHADLVPKLLEYSRSGGRVVLGVQFCYFLETDCTVPFFRLWGVPWSLAMHPVEKTFALNPDGVPSPLSSAALLPAFTANVLIVHARPCDDVVYSRVDPCEPGDYDQGLPYDISIGVGAAAWARIGQGFLGYVGDIHGEQAFARLTIEMCGVTIAPGDLGARDIFRKDLAYAGGDLEQLSELEPEIPLSPPGRTREVEVALRARRREAVIEEKRAKGHRFKEEGNIKFRRGDYLGAAESYRKAAGSDGPRPVYMSNLAAALLKLEQWDIAQSAASRALYHDPKNVKAEQIIYLQKFISLADRPTLKEEGMAELSIVTAIERRGDGIEWPNDRQEALTVEDEDEIEFAEWSDSEDCRHFGIRGPCKVYNKNGWCPKGVSCPYRHAPVSENVRDELGRNVCLYWLLLDECKNGNACAYAHDKTYLPTSGWWTNEKRLNRIRERYARITAVTGRPCPPEFYIREMNIKPFGYELWALVPYEPTTEERKAWERRGNWHADSYVLAEMAFYEINPKRRDALDALEERRKFYDNA